MLGINKLKESQKHYKFRLFSGFFIVGMVVLVISISISFRWFRDYIYKEINILAKSQLDNLNTSYETNMEQYRKEIQTIYQNPEVSSFLYSSNPKEFSEQYNISRYLQTVLKNDSAIDYILIFHNNEILMNTGRVFPSSDELQDILQQTKSTTNDNQNLFVNFKSERQMVIIQTERVYLNGESQYGVIMVINLQRMQDNFITKEENNSDAIYIMDENYNGIVKRTGDLNIDDYEVRKKITINTPGYFTFETFINGNKYIGNYFVHNNPRYVILTLQDFQSSEVEVNQSKRLMIFISFGLLLTTLIVSYVLTVLLYKPFENFLNKIKNNSTLIFPGENISEIKQIDTTIDRIIERVTMLSEQHNYDKVMKYLHDYEHETAMPLILELENRNEQALMALCVIDSNNNDIDFMIIFNTFKELLVELFSGCKIYLFVKNDKSFLIYIKELTRVDTFSNRVETKTKVLRAIDELYEKFNIRLHIALSETIKEEAQIGHIYKHLENYIRYNLIMDLPHIIDKDFVANNLDQNIPQKEADVIMQHIRDGNVKEAIEQINSLLTVLRNYKIKKVMLFIAEFAANLNDFNREFADNNRLHKEHYLEHYLMLLSFNNQDELLTWLTQMITNTCLELRVAKEKSLRTNMIHSIEYIRNNYLDKNLSVEVLADQFHISISYFSKLFKEYTGATFPEYVNDLRISLAKELIINNPSINMKKISDQTGFSNVSYFSAQFKKKYGVSPSQYRNNL